LPPGHACRHTRLTDNLVQFRTARYADNPLVVQGPGAGPDVTAAGVFGDLLMIAQSLGAPSASPIRQVTSHRAIETEGVPA
jgi:aspartokinase/homoserine dehydrogenase 1